MAIEIECSCGKRLFTKDQSAGKRTKCPVCGRVIVIPAVGTRPESAEQELDREAQAALERIAPSMRKPPHPGKK